MKIGKKMYKTRLVGLSMAAILIGTAFLALAPSASACPCSRPGQMIVGVYDDITGRSMGVGGGSAQSGHSGDCIDDCTDTYDDCKDDAEEEKDLCIEQVISECAAEWGDCSDEGHYPGYCVHMLEVCVNQGVWSCNNLYFLKIAACNTNYVACLAACMAIQAIKDIFNIF